MGTRITIKPRKQNINVTSAPKNRIQINTGGASAAGIDTITELRDVDASDADNNETLVFDSATQKYIVKPLPAIDGGSY